MYYLICTHHLQEDERICWPTESKVRCNQQRVPVTNRKVPLNAALWQGKNELGLELRSLEGQELIFRMAILKETQVSLRQLVRSLRDEPNHPLSRLCDQRSSSDNTSSGQDDLALVSQTLSLRCPISLSRLVRPVRSIYCTHPDCFDLVSFLSFAFHLFSWRCPICK